MGAEQAPTADRLAEWRVGVARLYLSGIALGIPVLIGAWVALRPPPRFDRALLYVVASWLVFSLGRLLTPERLLRPVVVAGLFLTGGAGLVVMGLSPGPFLALASAVIIGGVLFGRQPGLVLLASACGLVLGSGLLVNQGVLGPVSPQPLDATLLANWVRLGVFLALTAGLLLIVLTGLMGRMEEAWRATAAAVERERLEQVQRHLAEERALTAQRLEAVGRLAGGVAHDFNNLLVIIMTWSDLLSSAHTDAERTEGVDAIRQAAAQAAQLTRQLLSFAKRNVSQPGALDVDAFCEVTVRSLRRLVPDDVKVDFHPSSAPLALVDESQLGQVLLNLTINASDAMPRGGTLTIRSALLEPPQLPPEAPDPQGRYVTIAVEDTGTGMDEATRARLFEPFFTTKGPGHGTGLGLSSVYGIAAQAHGWVRVESELGKGTRFTVAFPVAPSGAVAAKAIAPVRSAPNGARHRILLVEDNEGVRATMATALRKAGIEPVEATDAEEALTLARRFRDEFSLLCTDGVMPGLPTHVLIDGFRQLFPSAPVLICSGYVEEDLISRGIAEGSMSVLPKPFTAESLVAKVNELLRLRA